MRHKRGNKYKTKDGLISILSTFYKDGNDYCMLVTLGDANDIDYRGYDGNRYKDPIKVADPNNLSEQEMEAIAGPGHEPYLHKVFI